MGGVIHETYDDSWAYVKVAGLPLPAVPEPGRLWVEVAGWNFHLPLSDGLGAVNRSYTDALRFDPCPYCGTRPSGSCARNELDHIQPKSQGGVDTADNRAGVCKGCNMAKRAQSVLGFLLGCPI